MVSVDARRTGKKQANTRTRKKPKGAAPPWCLSAKGLPPAQLTTPPGPTVVPTTPFLDNFPIADNPLRIRRSASPTDVGRVFIRVCYNERR